MNGSVFFWHFTPNAPMLLRVLSIFILLTAPLFATDTVVWRKTDDGASTESRTSIGRTLALAEDRGLLFQERSGEIHALEPDWILKATRNKTPFTPATSEEVAQAVREEFRMDFELYQTEHYTILYRTSSAYARWTGILVERLYDTFEAFWQKQGFTLSEPEFPLVLLIFANVDEYETFAKRDIDGIGRDIIGYYNFKTNRVACYDLSGRETFVGNGRDVPFATISRAILKRPNAEKQVATIIHEATHQLAFNRGLAIRCADIPLWYSEGIAMYFETPDLRSDRGWRGMGKPNPFHLASFKNSLADRPDAQLHDILTDDSHFRRSETILHAYDEAWALTWYLLKTHPEEFVAFAQKMSRKQVLIWDSVEERLEDFESVFGESTEVEKNFVRYFKRLR